MEKIKKSDLRLLDCSINCEKTFGRQHKTLAEKMNVIHSENITLCLPLNG